MIGMHIWRSLAEVPADLGPTVVAWGNFDGVHRGHRAVLDHMVSNARRRGASAVAMTFEPHPKAVHDPDHPPVLITGLDDKLERLADTGLVGVLVVDYTVDFAQLTPAEFARSYLAEGLGAVAVVVGGDTKFGRGNAGDIDTLHSLGATLGFDVDIIDDARAVAPSGRRWSSTWVRELLEDGHLEEANDVLGAHHRLRGVVVDGDKLGREIGFPTANLHVTGGMIPRHGVYAAWMSVLDGGGNDAARDLIGQRMAGAISIGINYTVGVEEVRIEGYAIDRSGLDLYGATMAFDLVQWRRPMLDFGSVGALIDALGADVEWVRAVLNRR